MPPKIKEKLTTESVEEEIKIFPETQTYIINAFHLKEIQKHILNHLVYYSPIKQEHIYHIYDLLKKINNVLSFTQIVYIRNLYMYMLSKRQGVVALRHGEEIYKLYKKDPQSIIKIAETYNLPPMNVVNQILCEIGKESHVIDNMMNKNNNRLPKNIQQQMPQLLQTDPAKWLNLDNDINNRLIYTLLTKKNIKFISNYSEGKKVPSIVFDKTILFDGRRIKWIELIPHGIYDNDFLFSEHRKIHYIFRKLGQGLVVYTCIICSKPFIEKMLIPFTTYKYFINNL